MRPQDGGSQGKNCWT
jgi:hypothetical protein